MLELKDTLKRIAAYDRPCWETLKSALKVEWERFCEGCTYPSQSEAHSNYARGRGSVIREMMALCETIDKETGR